VELIAISLVTIRSIVYVLQKVHRTFANLVAPPIEIAMNPLVRCKARLFL